MPHSAASDVGMHCLPMSHKKDASYSLAFYLIENSVLYPILNISKLNVKKH